MRTYLAKVEQGGNWRQFVIKATNYVLADDLLREFLELEPFNGPDLTPYVVREIASFKESVREVTAPQHNSSETQDLNK